MGGGFPVTLSWRHQSELFRRHFAEATTLWSGFGLFFFFFFWGLHACAVVVGGSAELSGLVGHYHAGSMVHYVVIFVKDRPQAYKGDTFLRSVSLFVVLS